MTDLNLEMAGVAEVQAAMVTGSTTSADLVTGYLSRIAALDRRGPAVHAIRCLAPDAAEQSARLDEERRAGRVRGLLHGVPVLVKDNIDVAGLPTTVGTLALEHSVPDRDADLVTHLRTAGAVILGKTNLTELANFMTESMPSGYSSLGGQVLNPYDASLTPCGSSSGSGAAAALGLATVTVGTETDGSIICPSVAMSLVGLKPSLGLVSGTGIVPISTSQDCAGPMCRTVSDAAALLGALTGEGASAYADTRRADTLRADTLRADTLRADTLRGDTLKGVRLAVPPFPDDLDAPDRELYEAALQVMRDQGADTVVCAALPETDETPLLVHEFACGVDAYLARLPENAPIKTLAGLAAWNDAHADATLKFGQTYVRKALAVDHAEADAAYRVHRARHRAVAGEHGIDAALAATATVAIVTPSWHGAGVSARAGYPSLTVPAGYRRVGRQPFGVTFLGPDRSEALLLSIGYAFEQASLLRCPVSEVNPALLADR